MIMKDELVSFENLDEHIWDITKKDKHIFDESRMKKRLSEGSVV